MMRYRVIYGETMPAWHRDFRTWKETARFIQRRLGCGDMVFRVVDLRFETAPSGALMAVAGKI